MFAVMISLWRGINCRRLAVRCFCIMCVSACIGSFIVLFCSVQYIEDHLDVRRRSVNILETDKWRMNVQDLVRENKELKETVELLRFGLRSDSKHEEYDVSKDINVASWQERGLKNIQSSLTPDMLLHHKLLNCKDVTRINIGKELGRGYTKITHLGHYNGIEVAVKNAGLDTLGVQKCANKKRISVKDCMLFSRYKIMKEVLLYQQLRHQNIVRLLGYCMQNDEDTSDIKTRGLTVVTELGIPVDMMMLLQLPWHQRFRIAVGLARLINFFNNSPLGSLVIHDFQLTQFVLVDGEIKMSDLDDVDNDPKLCQSSKDCFIGNKSHNNTTLKCIRGECQNFNEIFNIYNLHRFYLTTYLVAGGPQHLLNDLRYVETQTGLFNLDSKALLDGLEKILMKLRNGEGLKNITVNSMMKYKVIPQADYPDLHDYICPQSWSSVNCQLMMSNEDEAKQQCNEDEQCKAFVMAYDKTWTGYRSVYLKKDTSQIVYSANNIVYVKIT